MSLAAVCAVIAVGATTAGAASGPVRPAVLCCGGGGGPTVYLNTPHYTDALTEYTSPRPNDLWAGYRLSIGQENDQGISDSNYNDYHFATRCSYDPNDFNNDDYVVRTGSGAFHYFDDEGQNTNPSGSGYQQNIYTAVRECNWQGPVGAVYVAPACATGEWCNISGGGVVSEFFPELYTSDTQIDNLWCYWMRTCGSSNWSNTNSAGTINLGPYVRRACNAWAEADANVYSNCQTDGADFTYDQYDGTALEDEVEKLCANSATGALSVYSNLPLAVSLQDGIGGPKDTWSAEAYLIRAMNDCTSGAG